MHNLVKYRTGKPVHVVHHVHRLMLAQQLQDGNVVRKLVNREQDGLTPLMAAAVEGQALLVKELLGSAQLEKGKPMSSGRCHFCLFALLVQEKGQG